MAGLYIHIPFCKSRCIYCGFYSTTSHELRQRYVDAVCRELDLRRDYLHAPVHTIYIGGGTPSQLTLPQLRQLLNALPTSEAQEVTMECNPDDVTDALADALATLPVNRVSMGAQTFDDARLRFLHRRHTSAQVPLAVGRLRQAGIRNISVDLMYGFPGQTLVQWQQDVKAVLALDVEHLSAYALTVEEDTPLERIVQSGALGMPDDELSLNMYETLIEQLTAAGYEHYEISNFARPGFRSLHNSSYWRQVPYLGLGAAAHSYDLQSRQWNVADVTRYMESVEQGTPCTEREELDDDTRYNDFVMLSLRTREGLDLSRLTAPRRHYCLQAAQRYLEQGLLRLADSHLVLTRRGLFVSDMVMSDLMTV